MFRRWVGGSHPAEGETSRAWMKFKRKCKGGVSVRTISCGRNVKKKTEANRMVPLLTGNPGLLSHRSKRLPFCRAPITDDRFIFSISLPASPEPTKPHPPGYTPKGMSESFTVFRAQKIFFEISAGHAIHPDSCDDSRYLSRFSGDSWSQRLQFL